MHKYEHINTYIRKYDIL